jgi:uncharacterized protein YrrD
MPDPVSWLVIEHGWEVVVDDGTEVGTVDEVVGDTENDIFNGLAVSRGVLRAPLYVPAERVGEITEGRVRLTIGKGEFGDLAEHGEPPA